MNLSNRRVSRRRKPKISIQSRIDFYLSEIAYRGQFRHRFHEETIAQSLGVSLRSVKYARKALEASGAYTFERVREGRSTVLYVLLAPSRAPARAYARIYAWISGARRKGKPYCGCDAAWLAERMGLDQGEVEACLKAMREDGVFEFRVSKKGILIAVFTVQNRGGIGGKGDFSSRNRDKLKHRDRGLAFEKLRRKAWWLARRLEGYHHDNHKVRFDLRHAFNFAIKSLKAGYLAADIEAAYAKAAFRRHQDATDAGLCCGNPGLKWEPSSTVSLAWALLQGAQGRFGVQGGSSKAQSYESWLTGCTEREYGAWRDYAVRRAGEDAFLDQDMAALGPLWEGFRGAALGLSNGRGCA